MSELAIQLKSQMSRLNPKERADLAYFLINTLDDPESEEEVYSAWEKELESRWQDIEGGQAKGVEAGEALAKIRRELS